MNSGCSESNASAVCSGLAASTASCHHTSLSVQSTSWPVRRTTRTFSTLGQSATASSTAGLSAEADPRRYPPSEVITSFAWASSMRLRSASEENPPKTTECGAPIRAHASMAIAASGIMGR